MSIPLPDERRNASRAAVLNVGMLALGAVATGIAVDLVLPAIPMLPGALGGTTATAQFVLAGYVAGVAVGLVLFGWLADHFDRRVIFVGSLAAFAAVSFASAAATDMWMLVAFRFVQGAASSGPGVVAPGMVRTLFDDARAVRVIGFLGSMQSLVPALAPIAGAWLVVAFGWPASFLATGALAGFACLALAAWPSLLPAGRSGSGPGKGTYRELLRDPAYMRHALSYSLVLGGLVVFVFAAPVIIVKSMGGTIAGFIVLQVVGVSTFIVSANSSGYVATRVGAERLIRTGTALAVVSGLGFVALALAGGDTPALLIPPWIVMNVGFGLRGPPGYVAAIAAAGRNDARGSALIGLFQTGIMAGGTAALAPFLDHGLIAVAIGVVLIVAPALGFLLVLPAPKPGSEP